MGVDRYDVIFPFAFLARLPEYIHAGHVAAIDRSTMEFDSYLVLARNSNLADDVAFRRARQFVGSFRFASSDPDTQCFDHLVTQLSWIGHLAVRLSHHKPFQPLLCYLRERSPHKHYFSPMLPPDLLERQIKPRAAGRAAFSARDKHPAYAVLAVNNLSDIAAEILPGLLHVQNIIRSALILAPLNALGHAQQQTFGRGGQHQRIHCVVPIVINPLAILLLCAFEAPRAPEL